MFRQCLSRFNKSQCICHACSQAGGMLALMLADDKFVYNPVVTCDQFSIANIVNMYFLESLVVLKSGHLWWAMLFVFKAVT